MTEGVDPAPGWYPDPDKPEIARYWDGSEWTERTRGIEGGVVTAASRSSIPVEEAKEVAPHGAVPAGRKRWPRRPRRVVIGVVGLVMLTLAVGLMVASRDDKKQIAGERQTAQTDAAARDKPIGGENDVRLMVVSPRDGSVLPAGTPMSIEGRMSSRTQEIREVVLISDDVEVARWMTLDEVSSWSPPPGSYSIRLRAVLDDGQSVDSPAVVVTVVPTQGRPGMESLGRWIAVLASLSPSQYTPEQVQQRLAQLRTGDPRASLLASDDFPSLRPGYQVIYVAPFATKEEALNYCDQRRLPVPQQCYDRRLSMDPADRELRVGR